MKIVSRITTIQYVFLRGYTDRKTEAEDINLIEVFLVYRIKVKEWKRKEIPRNMYKIKTIQ